MKTYFVNLERGSLGEEDCHFFYELDYEPTRDQIEELLIKEDCGYDSHYCVFQFHRVN